LLEQSVCDPIDGKYDEIYNFACPASPPHYQADPIYTFKTSVLGTLNMLDLAKRSNAKILQASTSEIYGDPLVHPQNETYWGNVNTIGIRSCYDEGKRGAETLIYDYQRFHGVNVRVVRIFNTYGPGMNPEDGRVVSNFIIQALKGEDITVYGDGSQTRSFCYRDDLVEGIIRLMNAPDDVSFPVNVGNPNEFTIRELAEIVLEKIASRSRLVFLPLPQDDPMQRCPDISRAREHLGWEPKVSLREGLDAAIEYFSNRVATQAIPSAMKIA
jgi:UDP-glucuronate decarboxylase